MDQPRHDRYDYSPIIERPDYSWPDGKRLAVFLGLNVEHFAFGTGNTAMGHTLTALGPPPDHRNHAWRDYGLRVGIWRIFDLFDDLKLPACHLTNSTVFEHYPQIGKRMKARGDEVVGHGRTNTERQVDMKEADEAAMIKEATETIQRLHGTRPYGWMGPWISETLVTPDLLKEAGYKYLMDWPCDDQAFWMRTRSGPILHVPYPIEVNDSPVMCNRMQTHDDFFTIMVDQFDQLLRYSARQPLIMGIALHTFVIGQPFRLLALQRALEHMLGHRDASKVWWTTPGQIADHVMALPKGTVPGS
jgi:peptidoglycan/xylan/chitin deacetylase (PgdA/CDA1 family)